MLVFNRFALPLKVTRSVSCEVYISGAVLPHVLNSMTQRLYYGQPCGNGSRVCALCVSTSDEIPLYL